MPPKSFLRCLRVSNWFHSDKPRGSWQRRWQKVALHSLSATEPAWHLPPHAMGPPGPPTASGRNCQLALASRCFVRLGDRPVSLSREARMQPHGRRTGFGPLRAGCASGADSALNALETFGYATRGRVYQPNTTVPKRITPNMPIQVTPAIWRTCSSRASTSRMLRPARTKPFVAPLLS